MDYNTLLDMAADLGYRLSVNGAETFRVEESINRVLQAYGIKAEVFAIPSCLHVSIETDNGKPMTRIRRVSETVSNLDAVEKYNALSRKICQQRPEPKDAMQWLNDTERSIRQYPLPALYFGYFLVGLGFCLLFGGGFLDAVFSGICGMFVGLITMCLEKLKVNQFFRVIFAAFFLAIFAAALSQTGLVGSTDLLIIGALMILVPGLLFANAVRDIIYGDTNSGTNRIVQVLLTAMAIALGTGVAVNLCEYILPALPSITPLKHSLALESLASFIGCIGFAFLLNIHGKGTPLCAIGGVITWIAYRLIAKYTGNEFLAYFLATVIAAVYAEIMARIRKYPAISYLLSAYIPLIPGAGIYYTMRFALSGDMAGFTSKGTQTIAITGAIAVGVLLVSTIFRSIHLHKK